MSYQSPVANDWYFDCDYNLSGGPMCDSLARYDDYIVHFLISTDKEGFTPDQLKKVLQSTDDLMKAFLKK